MKEHSSDIVDYDLVTKRCIGLSVYEYEFPSGVISTVGEGMTKAFEDGMKLFGYEFKTILESNTNER